MDEITLYKLGILLFTFDLWWLMFYYFYATVEIYNLVEDEYEYLGHLWIYKKNRDYHIKIPQYMIDKSYTTKYQIVPGYFFCKINDNQKIRISFNGKYDIFTCVSDPITVKNYIATYASL